MFNCQNGKVRWDRDAVYKLRVVRRIRGLGRGGGENIVIYYRVDILMTLCFGFIILFDKGHVYQAGTIG